MHIALAIALPVIATVALVMLVRTLQRRLYIAGLKQITNCPGYMPMQFRDNSAEEQWQQITSHWNDWITGPLPTVIGAAIVALTLWLIAYLGWIAAFVMNRPYALAATPPWFDRPTTFGMYVVFGVATVIVGVPSVALFVAAMHWIGRHTLWPNPGSQETHSGAPRRDRRETYR